MAVKTARIIIKGKVQGVFFRDFAKQNANKLGIKGYAKNLKNGNLEIVAQADDKKIKEFIKLCGRGPIFAKVSAVDVSYDFGYVGDDMSEYSFFDIRYS